MLRVLPLSGAPERSRRLLCFRKNVAPPATPSRPLGGWTRVCVVALLVAYAAMAYTASLTKGCSFDEAQQLAVGYNVWLNADYRIEGANGDFIKRWATLPYLISRPNFVDRDDPAWKRGDAYELGRRFFFDVGNQPERLLRQGRAMVVVLGVVAGWLVFAWSRALFGTAGGLVSLGLFAFSPHMLALGAIVSTDMAVTLLLLASTRCVWGLLHEVTLARGVVSLGVVGLLVLAKLSALVIIPITVALVAVRLWAGGSLWVAWRGRRWELVGRRPQVAVIGAMVVLHGVGGWVAIWAHNGFRYEARPGPSETGPFSSPPEPGDSAISAFAAAADWAERTHFFPEGFQRGLDELVGNTGSLPAFMGGEWRAGGWRSFFPYTLWVKSSPSLLGLVGAAGFFLWSGWRRRRARPQGSTHPSAYDLFPVMALGGVYLAVAMTQNINIGHRHVLPVYPALFVFAGGAVRWAQAAGGRVALAALLGWMGWDSWAVRPDYLAYFGAQAGGPAKGYTRLVDSSLDWGMDLPGLKRWLERHDPRGEVPVYLAYFGTDDPGYYGIKARRLPGFFDVVRTTSSKPIGPGYYAISASLYQGVYTALLGGWSHESERAYRQARSNLESLQPASMRARTWEASVKVHGPDFWTKEFYVYRQLRFARLCAWLRTKGRSAHHVGHTIFIWKLDQAALDEALLGPPIELTNGPLVFRW